jgi:hypothetical protein
MTRRFAVVTLLLIVLSASSAFADNVHGQIAVVQTSSSLGTRFFIRTNNLSLFTTSADHKALLLEAFMRKAFVDVGYTRITCPGGITGTCGTVNFASVDITAIP